MNTGSGECSFGAKRTDLKQQLPRHLVYQRGRQQGKTYGVQFLVFLPLARDNANEDCQKVIEAMPGDPSEPDTVAACSEVGTVEHQVAALLRP